MSGRCEQRVEYYLEDERKTILEKATEQHDQIKSLYADLEELLKSDNIDKSDSNQIDGHLNAYVATLPASKDKNGNPVMDLEALKDTALLRPTSNTLTMTQHCLRPIPNAIAMV